MVLPSNHLFAPSDWFRFNSSVENHFHPEYIALVLRHFLQW